MGWVGVLFPLCSEEVMEVLRANKEELLTIIGVFIHDPLYVWQKEGEEENEKCAHPDSIPEPSSEERKLFD